MRLPKLTFANAIALIALFVALSGTVYAAAKINGKTIKKESIPANRLKAESVGGAQVNEASLGQVPSAARADSAGTAASAARADVAGRADVATRADEAGEAARAALVPAADHAKAADAAPLATDSRKLGGLDPSRLLRTNSCEDGGIKAIALIQPLGTFNARVASVFNCTNSIASVVVDRAGEFRVTFFNLRGRAMPVVSTLNGGVEASAQPLGQGEFRVTVFTVARSELTSEPFTLAIF